MDKTTFDAIVLGGGPAGYTSALYLARAGFDVLVIEKFSAGGQMTQTHKIDNYPGFDQGVDGFTLGSKMKNGAERFGAKTLQAEVLSVDLTKNPKVIETSNGTFLSKGVIIATGAEHKHLGIESEKKLIGKGVGYCATCDGMFFKGKTVAVIGGGNSAASDALYLSNICEKVYLVHRRDTLRAERVYHNPLMEANNVEFLWDNILVDILADKKVTGITIQNVKDNQTTEIKLDGVFISIGRSPETKLFKGQIDLDNNGYIIADETTKTNIPGVFAVGDVRTKPVRQIATAVSDGATSAHFLEEYLA